MLKETFRKKRNEKTEHLVEKHQIWVERPVKTCPGNVKSRDQKIDTPKCSQIMFRKLMHFYKFKYDKFEFSAGTFSPLPLPGRMGLIVLKMYLCVI